MKTFILVSLVCYLGAGSAELTTTAVPLGKTQVECRHQAYFETLNCTRYGFSNGTAEIKCLSATVLKYIECIEEAASIVSGAEGSPLGGILTGIEKQNVDIKCIVNTILDTIKCIINDQLSGPKFDWAALIKCLVTNIPALLMCFP